MLRISWSSGLSAKPGREIDSSSTPLLALFNSICQRSAAAANTSRGVLEFHRRKVIGRKIARDHPPTNLILRLPALNRPYCNVWRNMKCWPLPNPTWLNWLLIQKPLYVLPLLSAPVFFYLGVIEIWAFTHGGVGECTGRTGYNDIGDGEESLTLILKDLFESVQNKSFHAKMETL